MIFYSTKKHLTSALIVALLTTTVYAQDEELTTHETTPAIESSLVETDPKVIRLKNTFTETALLAKSFIENINRYKNNPQQLHDELTKISSTYLEPLRNDPEMGKALTQEQEEAAVNAVRENKECGEYADKVKKLWDETSYTMPLSAKFVAHTIAPDVEFDLKPPPNTEDEEEESTGSYAPGTIVGAGAILIIAALLAHHIISRKRKSQEEKERLQHLQREAEAKRKAEEEAAAAEAALPVLEEVKNANDYRMNPCIYSTDLDKNKIPPLSTPTRKEVKDNYELHVIQDNGVPTQRFAMTKAIMSFGRKNDEDPGHADIALRTEDMGLSRVHCVFMYVEYDDESFWLLAINQGSDRSMARTATLTRNGQSETGTTFVVHPGDVIDLTQSSSITVIKNS